MVEPAMLPSTLRLQRAIDALDIGLRLNPRLSNEGRAILPSGLRYALRWPRKSDWDDDYTTDDDLAFELSIRKGKAWAGGVTVEYPPHFSGARTTNCGEDLGAVASALGLASPVPWLVAHGAGIEAPWRATGLGVALYREAARVAMVKFRAVLVADACTGDGETSEEARRVWSSRRLASDPSLCMRGLVMGFRIRA